MLANPLRFTDKFGLKSWEDRWNDFKEDTFFNFGIDIGGDIAGRIHGAKCAKNCQPFKSNRDKREVATELCINIVPGVQADLIAGWTVLDKCVEHCLRMVGKECKTNLACY